MEVFWLFVIAGALYLAYRTTRSKKKEPRKSIGKQQNTPYKRTIQPNTGNSLKYEVSVREKTASEERSSELLKEATQRKNDKDLEGAIACLRGAYKLMAQSSISYPIKTYLRLPLYLQQAGHYKESIIEFERLLRNSPYKIAKEFSHVTKQKQESLSAMECAAIYDKMRLASQREKYFSHAVYYQLLSNASRAVGLKLQERNEELSNFMERELWLDGVETLLKKEKKEALSPRIADKGLEFSRSCTDKALQKLATDTAKMLEVSLEESGIKEAGVPDQGRQGQHDNNDDHLQWLGEAVRLHILQAREAWSTGNYDFARQEYQKTGYAMTQIEGQEWVKDKLKEEQALFAKDDPLYRKIIPIIQKQVSTSPGVLQTSIYGAVPFQKEEVSYALYFGALLNDIRREKKGRTYALFLPGETYEAG